MVRVFCYLRAFIIPFILVPWTMFLSLIVILLLLLPLPRSWADFIVRQVWCRTILFLAGVKVIAKGRENVPMGAGFLYLFTHSSHFDIPVLFLTSPKPFNFGAKIELFSVPFFGKAMELCGTLPIARDNRGKVMEVYRNAERRVAQGEAFALAPEGGRRLTPELAPFKSGPFIFAINAKMPLVPVVIHGTDEVMPKKSLLIGARRWRQPVVIQYLPPVSVADYTTESAKELRERVRQIMVEAHEKLREKGSRSPMVAAASQT